MLAASKIHGFVPKNRVSPKRPSHIISYHICSHGNHHKFGGHTPFLDKAHIPSISHPDPDRGGGNRFRRPRMEPGGANLSKTSSDVWMIDSSK